MAIAKDTMYLVTTDSDTTLKGILKSTRPTNESENYFQFQTTEGLILSVFVK